MNNTTLGRNGFGDEDPINNNEVRLCKDWIKKWITKRKTINEKKGSYCLKHAVERNNSNYISNGAFIQAAIDLGYSYRVSGPNAFFNMSFVDAKRNLEKSNYYGM